VLKVYGGKKFSHLAPRKTKKNQEKPRKTKKNQEKPRKTKKNPEKYSGLNRLIIVVFIAFLRHTFSLEGMVIRLYPPTVREIS